MFQPPHHSEQLKVSFPTEHVILLTLNRPKALNAMSPQLESDVKLVLDWFEEMPELWVAIITGEGRIFCAGADLKAWRDHAGSNDINEQQRVANNPYGFGAVSRRNNVTAPRACKPLIAAVNGGAHGGGLELILGCDLIVCGEKAKFSYPEVKRGVVAAQGGIPRLVHVAGHQLAAELVLLGRTITATEARDRFRLDSVNYVVCDDEVVPAAVKMAIELTHNSPDAVQSSRRALWDVSDSAGAEDAFRKHLWSSASERAYNGGNMQEGIASFVEKRKPVWRTPAKL